MGELLKEKVRKLKKNEIKLICYCSDSVNYKKFNDDYILTSPLNFIPYDNKFNKEKMKQLLDVLLIGSAKLKITIEKVNN